MTANSCQWDLDQYFDFDQATWANPVEEEPVLASNISVEEGAALTCHALQQEAPDLGIDPTLDFDQFHELDPLPAPQDAPQVPFTDYGDFSQWIASYHVPPEPCDYCRSKQLECFTYDGWAGCNACLALFRECSFTRTHAPETSRNSLNTLHSVPESRAQELGGLTGCRELISLTGSMDASRASLKSGNRFPRAAIKILKDWLSQHNDHPYPTDEERYHLKQETGLTHTQILNWLANARRRGKVPRRATSPAFGMSSSTPPINVPVNSMRSDDPALRGLTPMDRFKASPPEYEAAFMSDIANAVAKSNLSHDSGESSTSRKHSRVGSSGVSTRSGKCAPSVSSLETSRSSTSLGTAWSYGSRNSLGSLGSIAKKDRRRRKPQTPVTSRQESSDNTRLFQCTFCADTFKSKYDWTRHEKSLHLSLEKWICSPLGPVQTFHGTGNKHCVFCNAPSTEEDIGAHAETHNYSTCEEKRPEERTFLRKDHLRQHLRLVHGCEMHETMDRWRLQLTTLNSRCGFCPATFHTWDDRADHLSKHFRSGARMKDWKGDWGFDASVAAQVSNAVPYPFLIGMEAASVYPFRATDPASMRCDHTLPNGVCSMAPNDEARGVKNCWDTLEVMLGRYVKEQMDSFVVPTDAMLQRQARWIWYGDYDNWDQTAADHQEWLALFKQRHGLATMNGSEPSGAGGGGGVVTNEVTNDISSKSKVMEERLAEAPLDEEMNFDEFFLHDMEELGLGDASWKT